MPANSVTSMNRKAAPSTNVRTAKIKKRAGCRRSADNAPSPARIAREQQTHRLDKDIAEIEQLGAGRSAGGVARQHRIGGEQRREHDDVAEDEDPEPIGDDDALRRRPAAAAPAREFGWNRGRNRVDRCYRHAGRPASAGPVPFAQVRRPRFRARGPRSSRTIRTMIAAARRPRITSHQICQISEKPVITAKKAMTKPIGLLRGISMVS